MLAIGDGFEIDEAYEKKEDTINLNAAKILVVGVGGAGCNTVNRLKKMNIRGAKCIGINTDKQHLEHIHADVKILIGENVTRGLGAGGRIEIGRKAIEESIDKVRAVLTDADMVFVAAGMGGGTGTGAAPVVAQLAKENGAIVVGAVTMPFRMERGRMRNAEIGLNEMLEVTDTLVVIDNERLFHVAKDRPLNDAFLEGDKVLANMVIGITETVNIRSLVNLDFADVKTVLSNGDVAMVGVGEGEGPNRVEEAVRATFSNPLLDVDCHGAKGALIHISGDKSMTLEEAIKAGEMITNMMEDDDAPVFWGARIDDNLTNKIRIIAIIIGVTSPQILGKYDLASTPIKSDIDVIPTIEEIEDMDSIGKHLEPSSTLNQRDGKRSKGLFWGFR